MRPQAWQLRLCGKAQARAAE
ncbi:hypothetical protein STPH1_7414 [Streptomyces sp. OM5714]|nr:hypothetical protein STPH1_7414 [Streptomyces sp. OM5714]